MVTIKNMDEELMVDLIVLADLYTLLHLKAALLERLKPIINYNNACRYLYLADLHRVDGLIKLCLDFFDKDPWEMIKHPDLMELSQVGPAVPPCNQKNFWIERYSRLRTWPTRCGFLVLILTILYAYWL